MRKIMRKEIVFREITIPDGFEVCPACDGRGLMSKYDEGWTTAVYSSEHAALKECYACSGRGFIAGVLDV